MKNYFLIVSLFFGLASHALAEEVYQDDQNGFSVVVPTGWRFVQPNGAHQLLSLAKVNSDHSIEGGCSLIAGGVPETQDLTQKEVSQKTGEHLNKQTLINSYTNIGAKEVSIIQMRVRPNSEHYILSIVAEFKIKISATGPYKLTKAFAEVHSVPGAWYNITCLALKPKFNNVKSDFRKILMSFKVL